MFLSQTVERLAPGFQTRETNLRCPGESAWVNQDSIACQELLPEPETPTKRRGAKRAQPDDAEQAAVKSQETDAEGAKQTGKEERKRGPHLRGVRSASTQAKQAEGGSSSSRKSRGNQAEDGKDREKGEHAALGEDFEVLQEADEKEGEAAQEEGGGAQEEEGGAQEKGGGAKGEEEEAEDVEGHVTGAESRTVEVGGSKIIFPSGESRSADCAKSFSTLSSSSFFLGGGAVFELC